MWDVVTGNLQAGGDETTSFGPRREGGSALFRVDTQASIASSTPVTAPPTLTGASARKGLAVGVDTCVYIFDAACSDDPVIIELDCIVEHVVWSDDETFLVVADRKGCLHFVDVVNERVLFTQALKAAPARAGARAGAGASASSPTFFAAMVTCAAVDVEQSHLLLLAKSGLAFLFSNLNFSALRDAISAGNMAEVGALKTAITLAQIDTLPTHKLVHGARLVLANNQLSIIVFGDGLSVWTQHGSRWAVAQHVIMLFRGNPVLDIVLADSQKHMLVLDSRRTLSLWHYPEFIMIKRFTHLAPVQSILLLPAPEGSATSSEATREQNIVATIAPAGPATGRRELAILTFVAGEPIFSLDISEVSFVLGGADSESLHLLDSSSTTTPLDLSALQVYVRCLTPTLPTNRFYHLLHKQRFDEAVEFARAFGLDVELVDRVRITTMLDDADKDPCSLSLTSLKAALGKVADLLFVVDSCLHASFATLADTLAMLEYGIERLTASTDGQTELERLRLRTQLRSAVKRLGTFHLAHLTGDSGAFPAAQWHHFKNADLLRELTMALTNGHLATAALIWTRHVREYDLPADAPAIFAAIPASLPLPLYLPWLEAAVLPVVRPEHHLMVLRWADQRARVLELTDRTAWPANALAVVHAIEPIAVLYSPRPAKNTARAADIATPGEFVDLLCGGRITAVLPANAMSVSVSSPTQQLQKQQQKTPDRAASSDLWTALFDAATSLSALHNALTDLDYLQAELGLRLSLAEYARETPSSIVARLLERARAPEVVATVIANEVRPYLRRHGLAHDETCLLVYLQDLLQGGLLATAAGFHGGLSLGDSSWEQKALAVIDVLTDMDVRVTATLELLRRATVPISPGLAALMAAALTWNHPNAPELREQARLVTLKGMLLPYGITNHNMADESLARGLVRRLLSRTDIPTALSDALQIVAAYHHLADLEAYVFRLQILLEGGDHVSALALFAAVPSQLQRPCVQEVVMWTFDLLDELAGVVAAGPAGPAAWAEVDSLHRTMQTVGQCLQQLLTRAGMPSARLGVERQVGVDPPPSSGPPAALAVPLTQLQCWHSQLATLVRLVQDFGLLVPVADLSLPVRQLHWLELLVSRVLDPSAPGGLTPAQAGKLSLNDVCRGGRHQAQSFGSAQGSAAQAQALVIGATLLGLPPRNVVEVLAQRCALSASVDENPARALAVHLVHNLHENGAGPGTAAALAHLSSVLLAHAARNPAAAAAGLGAVAKLSHSLARLALQGCSGALLCDVLELVRGGEIAVETLRQCDTGDYTDALGGLPGSPAILPSVRHRVTPSALGCAGFREEGLVLASQTVLPLALRFANALVQIGPDGILACAPTPPPDLYRHQRVAGRGHIPGASSAVGGVSRATHELVQYFALNSHAQLSFGVSVHALLTCAQHAAVNAACVDVTQQFGVVLPKAVSVLTTTAAALVTKILAAPVCDRALALAYMAGLPKANAFDLFHAALGNSRRDPARLVALTLVAQGFGLCWDDTVIMSEGQVMHGNATWLLRLAQLGLVVDVAMFNSDPAGVLMPLLPELVQKWLFHLPDLMKLSDAFSLDRQAVLMCYINTAIAKQVDHPTSGLQAASMLLPDPAVVGTVLMAALDQVHPYNYERLAWILALAVRFGSSAVCASAERAQLVLQILNRYTRQAPPGPYERSCMLGGEFIPDESPGSVFASRLPFHALLHGEAMRILTPELTLATAPELRPLAVLLGHSSDELHTMLVHNVLAAASSSPSVPFSLLEPVLALIANAEMAVMACKLVADEGRLAGDKLAALTWAWNRAQQWLAELPPGSASRDKAAKMVGRLNDTRRRVQTELDLQRAGCTQPAIYAALGDPARLISLLYEDAASAGEGTTTTPLAGDQASPSLVVVHALCLAVADRYDQDAEQLRRALTQDWLSTPNAGQATNLPKLASEPLAHKTASAPGTKSLFSALELPPAPAPAPAPALAGPAPRTSTTGTSIAQLLSVDDNLRRAVALLKLGDRTTTVLYLLKMALESEESATLSPLSRLRAFRALLSIAPISFIVTVSQHTLPELREQLLSRCYVLRLAALQTPYSPVEFLRMNKEGLVRGLWRNHRHVPEAVILVVDLLLDYDITDVALWDNALQALVQLGLTGDVARVLSVLAGRPLLWAVPSLSQLYMGAVASLLAAVGRAEAGPARWAVAQELCALVVRAPFVVQEDLSATAETLAKIGEPCAAFLCALVVVQVEKRNTLTSSLLRLKPESIPSLLGQLDDLSSPLVDSLRTRIFDHVDAAQQHQILVETPHFGAFVAHLLAEDRIHGLLEAILRANRLSQAEALLGQYARSNAQARDALVSLKAQEPTLDTRTRLHRACEVLGFVTCVQVLASAPA